MKPQRMRITHELLTAYDMLPKMHVLVCPFSALQLLLNVLKTWMVEGETRHGGEHDPVPHRRIRAVSLKSDPRERGATHAQRNTIPGGGGQPGIRGGV